MSGGTKKPVVVVAGDVAVDWFSYPTPSAEETPNGESALWHQGVNWRLNRGTRMVARPGGAFLLARMVRGAVGEEADVRDQKVDEPLAALGPERLVHSLVSLERYPVTRSKQDKKDTMKFVYRVKSKDGFSGPSKADNPVPPRIYGDDPDADIVVLDDSGNCFRDFGHAFPDALKNGNPFVFYKTNWPLARGPLWDVLHRDHRDRTVLILHADDLRRRGVQMSRCLSWDRTAEEFVEQMNHNRGMRDFREFAHLVVRFGLDGAVYWNRETSRARLYFDPDVSEGGYNENFDGDMLGYTSVFVAAMVRRYIVGEVVEPDTPCPSQPASKVEAARLGAGVREGIAVTRRMLKAGFGPGYQPLSTDSAGDSAYEILEPDYPDQVFSNYSGSEDGLITDVEMFGDEVRPEGSPLWTILDAWHVPSYENLPYRVVRFGLNGELKGAPKGKFGKLVSVDRVEIESYGSIRNLMREYLDRDKPLRPLCIAVFGPPGSGKSFGIKEVAASIGEDLVDTTTFNVSEWNNRKDLEAALHRVRDVALGEKTPLVFFDEFDSRLGDQPWGWLKHFLAPMQDGEFRGETGVHPVGKAIFVFAGGTCSCFADFAEGRTACADTTDANTVDFVNAKGPDFVSRLRGFVDVLGPNPLGTEDYHWKLRRAVILRNLIERLAPNLISGKDKEAKLDPALIRAMLDCGDYRHGIRSMESLFDMSTISGREHFDRAAIPPRRQLAMHANSERFNDLLHIPILDEATKRKWAMKIHQHYLDTTNGDPGAPERQEWHNLPEHIYKSNLQQAEDYLPRLAKIGCTYTEQTDISPFDISSQMETLAAHEHERWIAERRLRGWILGARHNATNARPSLIEWDELSEEDQQRDRDAIEVMAEILNSAGFRIVLKGQPK